MADPDWLHLPPLSALRAFEAAARLGGFSAAARVLNVTHAAVAQQVRALEEHLGTALIHREGRGMALTPDGAQLGARLTEGFSAIQGAISAIRQKHEGDPLTVTMTPSFAIKWMMPRLWKFWEAHPGIAVSLRPDIRILDLRREGIDIGIRYGDGNWPGLTSTFLTSARLVVVASPGLVDGRTDLTRDELMELPWVMEENWPEGLNWLRKNGLDPDRLRVTHFANGDLAASAAQEGYGLFIETVVLAEQDQRSGRLRIVFDPKEDLPAYFIVTPPGPQRAAARTFVQWLKSSL